MGKAATQTKSISERAKEVSGNAVPAVKQVAAPPAHLAQYAAEDFGKGTSQAVEDNLVPLIYVLQPLSPQVDRRDPAYIEGALPGDIFLRGAPAGLELIRGNRENSQQAKDADDVEIGMVAMSCFFYKDVGEWLPREEGGGKGNGFVGRHNVPSAKMVPGAKPDPDGDPNHWVDATGEHELIETRNHALLVFTQGRALPYLLPLSSTGHGVSRAWMQKMNQKVILEGDKKGEPYPSYAYLYRLTTEQRQNDQGKWFSLVVEDERWATTEEYLAGRKLNMQFSSGEKKAEAPISSSETGGGAQTNTDAIA